MLRHCWTFLQNLLVWCVVLCMHVAFENIDPSLSLSPDPYLEALSLSLLLVRSV